MNLQHFSVGPALILDAFAFVFFVLAGLGIPEPARFRFLGWGLACLTAAQFFGV